MIKNTSEMMLDDLDKTILLLLQADGRLSNLDLARQINLSPPATHARLKQLEKEGYIRQFTTLVDRDKAGFDLLCFIHVALQMHQLEQVENFRTMIRQIPEVLECYHITGEYDYLLKVVLHNRKDLERFVVDRITPIHGIARIHTSLALTEVKNTTELPLE